MSGRVTEYYDRCLRNADTTLPHHDVQKVIASKIDDISEKVISKLMGKVEDSKEHKARVAKLKSAPRLAGAYSKPKTLFPGINPLEQMVVVKDWLENTSIRKQHTFFFSNQENDDYVPVQVKPRKKSATLMHTVLGSTSGSHKAPKYADWADSDPREDSQQEVFRAPLEALEIVRQPQFSGATLLKGNAFERDLISSDWRYGDAFACVESRGQAKNSQKKQKSAGLNACAFVEKLGDASDPTAKEVDFAGEILFEEYTDEGYADDLNTSVSPAKFLEATQTAIVGRDDRDLTELVEKLAIAKMGVPKTPALRQYIARKLERYRTRA